MTNEPGAQESLFEDPLGLRLRTARERQGLSLEQAAQQLKLPVAVVEAMEREDWARLGARIYVRSYLGSYLRLLGLPATLADQVGESREPAPQLVPLATSSRMRRTLDASMRNLVYLVMTAVLVVPVVLVARAYQARHQVQDLTLDAGAGELSGFAPQAAVPPSAAAAAASAASAPAATTPAAVDMPPPVEARIPAAAPAADPVLASLAPFQSNHDAAALVLRFRDESWIEVIGRQGERLERGLVAAGGERRYEAGQVGRITLGNADGVDVRHAGQAIDLTPFRAANVARFAVSSEGQPAPAGH